METTRHRIRAYLKESPILCCYKDLESVLDWVDSRLSEIVLPEAGESAAVAIATPKIAALCYDRIWVGLRTDIPSEIGFRGASDAEREFLSYGALYSLFKESAENDRVAALTCKELLIKWHESFGLNSYEQPSRLLADDIATMHRIGVTSVYPSLAARDLEYKPGKREIVVATLSMLEIPVEEALAWAQVLEFRKDKASRLKFRRFVHWLDAEMVGRSPTFISDEISSRLEDYRLALRKHGIAAKLGTLSSAVDSKALIGGAAAVASMSYAADPHWALFAGGAIVVANCAVQVARALLDVQGARDSAPEIAFVVAVQDASLEQA